MIPLVSHYVDTSTPLGVPGRLTEINRPRLIDREAGDGLHPEVHDESTLDSPHGLIIDSPRFFRFDSL